MNKKLFKRFLCAVLSVLMLVGMLPAMAVFADDGEKTQAEIEEMDANSRKNYYLSQSAYNNLTDRLEDMDLVLTKGDYQLYFDHALGTVGYYNTKTDEWLFTDPYDYASETNPADDLQEEMRSQIIIKYIDGTNEKKMNSFADAAARMQIELVPLKDGIRVEYAIGERNARKLLPMLIEKTSFEEKILAPMEAAVESGKLDKNTYNKFKAFFNEVNYIAEVDAEKPNAGKIEALEERYPILKEKKIDLYVLNTTTSEKDMRRLEGWIKSYCPDYTFDDLTDDHDPFF